MHGIRWGPGMKHLTFLAGAIHPLASLPIFFKKHSKFKQYINCCKNGWMGDGSMAIDDMSHATGLLIKNKYVPFVLLAWQETILQANTSRRIIYDIRTLRGRNEAVFGFLTTSNHMIMFDLRHTYFWGPLEWGSMTSRFTVIPKYKKWYYALLIFQRKKLPFYRTAVLA